MVTPRSEDEVRLVAAAAARFRLPITVAAAARAFMANAADGRRHRAEMTKLDRVIRDCAGPGHLRGGARMERVDMAARDTGRCCDVPSTKRFAMGGFVSGGSGGIDPCATACCGTGKTSHGCG